MAPRAVRVRNDPAQYDELAGEWWDPRGTFAMLHWLAAARAALVPRAPQGGAVLVDVGCGGGLLAPHVAGTGGAGPGYTVVGVDVARSALRHAADHGEAPVQADAARLPLADGCADVVCAGEILEHVPDVGRVIEEACRVLRPGGTLVVDTIADTLLARLLVVVIAERIPGAAPPGLHDPSLFVDRRFLVRECSRHGVALRLRGLRPSLRSLVAWRLGRRSTVEMVGTWSTAVLFQGVGAKETCAAARARCSLPSRSSSSRAGGPSG